MNLEDAVKPKTLLSNVRADMRTPFDLLLEYATLVIRVRGRTLQTVKCQMSTVNCQLSTVNCLHQKRTCQEKARN
jgi:hypothetical protein